MWIVLAERSILDIWPLGRPPLVRQSSGLQLPQLDGGVRRAYLILWLARIPGCPRPIGTTRRRGRPWAEEDLVFLSRDPPFRTRMVILLPLLLVQPVHLVLASGGFKS